jgi:hypothetical protein
MSASLNCIDYSNGKQQHGRSSDVSAALVQNNAKVMDYWIRLVYVKNGFSDGSRNKY